MYRETLLSELASKCYSPKEFMNLLSDLKKSLLENSDAEMVTILAIGSTSPRPKELAIFANWRSKVSLVKRQSRRLAIAMAR